MLLGNLQAAIAQAVLVVQICAIAFILASDTILAALNLQLPPDWRQTLQEKRMAYVMGAWFLGNTIKNSLLSTGAFEVFYDGELIFSKLATQRMPGLNEVFQGIQEAMEASQ